MRIFFALTLLPALLWAAPPKKFTKNFDKGNAAYGRGRFTEAIELYTKAEAEKGSYSDTLLNRMYLRMADSYEQERDAKAAEYYAKALNNAPTSSLSIQAATLQGKYLLKSGRASEAEKSFALAQQHMESLSMKGSRSYASVMQSIGILKVSKGEYNKAEPYFLLAQEGFKNNGGTETNDYANVCNNLALIYSSLGDYNRATQLFTESLRIKEKLSGKNLEYATGVNNMAVMHLQTEAYATCESEFRQALDIYEKTPGKESVQYATTLNNLGILHWQLRKVEAEQEFREALRIREAKLGKEDPSYATSLNNLGAWLAENGRYEEATKLLTEAQQIRANVKGNFHPDYIASLIESGSNLMWQSKFQDAKPLFIEASGKTLSFIKGNFAGLSEKEKIAFVNSYSRYFDRYSHYGLLAAGYTGKGQPAKKAPFNDSDVYGQWFNLRLATKGMVLNSMQKMRGAIQASGDKALIESYTKWEKLNNEIANAYNLTVSERKQKNIDLTALESEARILEKDLSLKSSAFAATVSKPTTWQDIKATLKPGEAAIEMVRVKLKQDTAYVALIVTATSSYPEPVIFSNGRDLEAKYIKYYRNCIQFKMIDEFSYKYFWKPLSDKLGILNVKKVYFSPDGVFHIINLNTVPVPDKKGKFVFDEVELFYLSSLKELTDVQARGNLKKALLLGDPDYNLQENKFKGEGERSIKIDDSFSGLRSAQFSDLPGTSAEVKSISTALLDKKWEVTSFNEKEATEERIKQSGEVQVLHIATHGFFIPARGSQASSAMLNSGVVLAGVSATPDPSRGEDGILTAAEASNLKLDNTDLVVLSACESGLGALSSGEGVFGLQRGLKVAGAKGVIMSLWKVNDEATQELMSAFYSEWTRNPNTLSAFRYAQDKVRLKYKDPYYWGAFVYIGK